jgi:hypothetical protein
MNQNAEGFGIDGDLLAIAKEAGTGGVDGDAAYAIEGYSRRCRQSSSTPVMNRSGSGHYFNT